MVLQNSRWFHPHDDVTEGWHPIGAQTRKSTKDFGNVVSLSVTWANHSLQPHLIMRVIAIGTLLVWKLSLDRFTITILIFMAFPLLQSWLCTFQIFVTSADQWWKLKGHCHGIHSCTKPSSLDGQRLSSVLLAVSTVLYFPSSICFKKHDPYPCLLLHFLVTPLVLVLCKPWPSWMLHTYPSGPRLLFP